MKMVMVEWVDSAFAQGWMDRSIAESHTESHITSVGILVYEDKTRLTIMQDMSNKNSVGDGITIPACSIKRIRQLKVGGSHA